MIDTTLTAISSFLLHPLFYIGIAAFAFIGAVRVAKERASFHTRVYAKRADFVLSLLPGLLAGLIASFVLIGYGLTLTTPVLLLVAAASLLLLLTGRMQLQSPAYYIPLATFALALLPSLTLPTWLDGELDSQILYPSLLLFAAVTLLAQALLVRFNGAALTSPRLEIGKRGRFVGVHIANRLWLLPLVVFIPEGVLPAFSYWPLIHIEGMTFQPLLLPVLVGFGKKIRSLPKDTVATEAKAIYPLAVLAFVGAAALYFLPEYWFLCLWSALLAGLKLALDIRSAIAEKNKPAFFTEEEKGCRVVGVLPGSPAEKMGIAIGEEIAKVNGQPVHNEQTMYQALQINPVYCKLEIKDLAGEARFVHGPLYSGEHYQLGALLVRQEEQLADSIV
ncbi:MAG: PDZ domain-containing protein [Shouchella clausii]